MPTRNWLIDPLRKSFGDASMPEAKRVLAANMLARFLEGDVAELVELALQSTPRQFEVIAHSLGAGQRTNSERAKLVQVTQDAIPVDLSEDEKDRLAVRKANAILLLRESGEDQNLWPALQHSPDPRIRSFLIDHLGEVLDRPEQLTQRLAQEDDPGVRQAIIFILGSAAKTSLPVGQSPALVETLLRLYRDDADGGVHSAAEWALRTLGLGERVEELISTFSVAGLRPGFRWYVTRSRITMIVLQPPRQVQLGSPKTEPDRDDSDETQWTAKINWDFAISATEITQRQFKDICTDYAASLNDFASQPDCPANVLTWLDATRFCRLLSERDGIKAEEMAVPEVDQLEQPGHFPAFTSHAGYRLPWEVEWEVACRGGTITPRFFGYAPALLPHYAWYIGNSSGQARPVGQRLPNPLGLFDMLGNVSEWCQDIYSTRPDLLPREARYSPMARYVNRGGDFTSNERMLRAANRRVDKQEGAYSRGFRIAHTILPKATAP